MKSAFYSSLVLTTILGLQACSTNYHHRHGIHGKKGQTEYVDAASRGIFVVPNFADPDGKPLENGDPLYRMCAEPSPDVFTAIALAASAKADAKNKLSGSKDASKDTDASFEGVLSLSESGATIERTQTINLMRESMYRTCERYMSGAINQKTMAVQAARDQRAMVSVLAIEQLTGVVKRKPTILTSEARSSMITANAELTEKLNRESEALAEARKNKEEIANKLSTAKSEYDNLNNGECEKILKEEPHEPAPSSAGSDAGSAEKEAEALKLKQGQCRVAKSEVTKLETDLATATETQADAQAAHDKTEKLLREISANYYSASSSTSGSGDPGSDGRTLEEISEIAYVVGEIVSETFDPRTEMVYQCNDVFSKYISNEMSDDGGNKFDSLLEGCLRVYDIENERARDRLSKDAKQRLATYESFAENPVEFNLTSFEAFWEKVKDGNSDQISVQKLSKRVNEIIGINGISERDVDVFNDVTSATTKSELKIKFDELDTNVKEELAK